MAPACIEDWYRCGPSVRMFYAYITSNCFHILYSDRNTLEDVCVCAQKRGWM